MTGGQRNTEQLSERARTLLTIGEHQNSLMVSAISVWEIAVKHRAGKLPLPLAIDEWFALAKTRPGITIEPLDPPDAIVSTQLPGDFHKYPADRIIVAIAYRRNIKLMTCNPDGGPPLRKGGPLKSNGVFKVN